MLHFSTQSAVWYRETSDQNTTGPRLRFTATTCLRYAVNSVALAGCPGRFSVTANMIPLPEPGFR